MKLTKRLFIYLVPCALFLHACTSIDLYEKSVAIPGHSWKSNFKPSFTFAIKDTASAYQLFLVLRHNDKYNYNNIYINLIAKLPGTDSVRTIRKDFTLATDDKGWLGNGMDDIYEHRIAMGDPERLKPGNYTFTLEQIMREDPLRNVFDVGLRLEKRQ